MWETSPSFPEGQTRYHPGRTRRASRGAISAVNIAVNIAAHPGSRGKSGAAGPGGPGGPDGPDGPDGIVLTSSVFGPSHNPTVDTAAPDAIRLPVLVAHHKKDECRVTPFSGVAKFMQFISNATVSELIVFEEGARVSQGRKCGAKSHHGFPGSGERVVKSIAEWIKSH